MPTILIGGDIAPIGRAVPLFESGDAHAIFGDLLPELEAADLVLANLEVPLIDRSAPIEKNGPVLGAPTGCAAGLRRGGVDAVTLANNHILDHGPQGLESTVRACQEAGMATFGVGRDRDEAGRILVRNVGGTRIGCLGMAEREWCIAGRNAPGAYPLGAAEYVRAVRRCGEPYDFLVVLVHGGLDYHPYPTPALRDLCRFLVEEGARAVICQHSHCPGCHEWYQDALIVYGQGNFVFESRRPMMAGWYQGFLVHLTLERGHCRARFVPLVQGLHGPGARRMPPEQEELFQQALNDRAEAIQRAGYVEAEFLRACRERRSSYLSSLHGHGRLLRRLNARLNWLDWIYSSSKAINVLSVVGPAKDREVVEALCTPGMLGPGAGAGPSLAKDDG